MTRATPVQLLKRAEQKKAKAKAEIKRLTSAIREQERKKDTRRKIILGAMLLEEASKSESVAKFLENCVSRLERPGDKAVFADFDLPSVSQSPSAD